MGDMPNAIETYGNHDQETVYDRLLRGVWKDVRGQEIPLGMMGDRHLQNTYNLVLKSKRPDLAQLIEPEMVARGFLKGDPNA